MAILDREALRFTGERYALTLSPDRPFATLTTPEGDPVVELFVPSSIHAASGLDDTTSIEDWRVEERDGETVFSLRTGSSVWDAKRYTFRCSPHRLVYEVAVEGDGQVAEARYFGGNLSALPRWGSGFFPSGHAFTRGFNPEPNTHNDPRFDPLSGAVIDLSGGPLPGKRHWFFNPAPFCLGFETVAGWLGLGVEAEAGANGFSEYRYHGGDSFWLSLAYDGGLAVRGWTALPSIGFDFADDPFEAVQFHVASLRSSGKAPIPTREHAAW